MTRHSRCAECDAEVLLALREPGGEGKARPVVLEPVASTAHLFGFEWALEEGVARRVGFGFTGLRFKAHVHPPKKA